MTPSAWALTLAYWLHMIATVVWIGGLAALSIFVLPAARRSLPAEQFGLLLVDLQRRLDPIGWFCLAALAGTGMFQMSANPNYAGFLAVHNPWSVAILVKHVLFLVMTSISAYMTWAVLPGLRRAALQLASAARAGQLAAADERLSRQELRLLRLNLFLGLLVLGLTALARSVS